MSRTITHLYDTYDEATRAVRMLEDAGIAHSDISIVGQNDTAATTTPATDPAGADTSSGSGAGAGASVGTIVGGGAGLLAGIGALAIPGVGPVVAAGWLIATLTGAGVGAGAGGLLGSLVGAGHREEDAHVYAEGVRRGGTLVSVRVDDAQAAQVDTMLNGTARVDVAQRGAEYRAAGWDRFDETRPVEPRTATTPAGTVGGVTGISTPVGVTTGMPGVTETTTTTTTQAVERDRLGSSFQS